jgi:polar amino acid transport system substrate-binding protein
MRLIGLAVALSLILVPLAGETQPVPNSEIAPTGKLRVAALGVRVLSDVAQPVGKFIAERLGVSYEAVVYTNLEAYAQSFGKREWDITIGPRVLAEAQNADVSPDLWLIPLLYVAAPGREFADAGQVDRPGVKVGAPQDAPSERYLSRTLKSAELVRLPFSAKIVIDAIEMLRSGKADVFGADVGVVHSVADGLPGAKIIPGAFNTVRVVVAVPKGRSPAAQAKLAEIVNEAKRTGVVQRAIDQTGLRGVRVAPD